MNKYDEQILVLNKLKERVKKQLYSCPSEKEFVLLLSLFREHLKEHDDQSVERRS